MFVPGARADALRSFSGDGVYRLQKYYGTSTVCLTLFDFEGDARRQAAGGATTCQWTGPMEAPVQVGRCLPAISSGTPRDERLLITKLVFSSREFLNLGTVAHPSLFDN